MQRNETRSRHPVVRSGFKPKEKAIKARFRLYINHEFQAVFENEDAAELWLHEWQLDNGGAQEVHIFGADADDAFPT